MTSSRSVRPPDPPDPSDVAAVARIGETLIASGFTSVEVDGLLNAEVMEPFADGWFGPVRLRTEANSSLATLVRLFSLGMDVPTLDLADVRGAEPADWVSTRLLSVRRTTAHPLATVRPLRMWGENRYLVSDAVRPGINDAPFVDFVQGATPSSTQLARITLRRRFRRVLDLGTGEGIQAILASRHCDEVVATDSNARALDFTRFNLALNGIDNVELRLGEGYEPVQEEVFDLIVSNPPFVISPAVVAQFRDSGLPTDTMTESVVKGAARHLAPDGWAFILGQWVHAQGERWQDRVEGWVDGTDCDAWFVQHRGVDSMAHAIEWLSPLGRADPKEADRQFERWMRYFEDQGIDGVGSGFVVLRKATDSEPWFMADEVGMDPADGAGKAIAQVFEAKDWLEAHPESGALLDATWRLVEHARLDTTGEPGVGMWGTGRRVLRQDAGLRLSLEVTDDLAGVLAGCDGQRTLRSIIDAWARGRGRDSSGYGAPVETAFRKLILRGFVLPVSESA